MFNRIRPRSRRWLKRFNWAAGVEDTFVPQFKEGQRSLEEYKLTQHYRHWKGDLRRAASLGIEQIRWGVPWYLVEAEEGKFDWRWIDQVLLYLINVLHVEPIVDLVHYGTPQWLEGSFLSPRFPQAMANFAGKFAERYRGFVQCYTPLNEPTVTAEFCGRRGQWPPYQTGERGYVAVLLAVARGMQASCRTIRKTDPKAVIFAVEAMNHYASGPNAAAQARLKQAHDFICFDLVTGRVGNDHILGSWLLQHGASESDLAQLQRDACSFDVFGLNFYPWSAHSVAAGPAGEAQSQGVPARGGMIADVAADCYEHSKLPVYITETSAVGERRLSWMNETICGVNLARKNGLPVIGYTWFPVFSMVEWDYRGSQRPLADHLLHLGLWELRADGEQLHRRATPAVAAFRRSIKRRVA